MARSSPGGRRPARRRVPSSSGMAAAKPPFRPERSPSIRSKRTASALRRTISCSALKANARAYAHARIRSSEVMRTIRGSAALPRLPANLRASASIALRYRARRALRQGRASEARRALSPRRSATRGWLHEHVAFPPVGEHRFVSARARSLVLDAVLNRSPTCYAPAGAPPMAVTPQFVGESFGKPESVEQCLAIMAEVAEEQRDRNRHLDTKAGSIAGFAGTALTLNLTLGRPLLEQHFSTYPWAHGLIRTPLSVRLCCSPLQASLPSEGFYARLGPRILMRRRSTPTPTGRR
jgi:hypothetical protein